MRRRVNGAVGDLVGGIVQLSREHGLPLNLIPYAAFFEPIVVTNVEPHIVIDFKPNVQPNVGYFEGDRLGV